MSTDSKSLAIIPRTVDEVKSLSDLFAKSSLVPEHLRGKSADVLVSIIAGQELGLPPMASLRGVHVVKGRPILSADTMVGVVLGSGLAEYFVCVEETATSATYETRRKGTPSAQRCTWTMEDAKRAGLNGDNWTKHPRAMLKARAKAMLARDAYPDVLAGVYDTDEAREFGGPTGSPPTDAIDVDVIEVDPLDKIADELIAEVEKATAMEDIQAFAPRFNALPKGTSQRARAHEAYKRAKEEILRNGVVEQEQVA